VTESNICQLINGNNCETFWGFVWAAKKHDVNYYLTTIITSQKCGAIKALLGLKIKLLGHSTTQKNVLQTIIIISQLAIFRDKWSQQIIKQQWPAETRRKKMAQKIIAWLGYFLRS
jgi:hypothetical protein